jgi:hypothetical protein
LTPQLCVHDTFAEILRSLRSKTDMLLSMQCTRKYHRLLSVIAFPVREEIDSSAGPKSRGPLTELGRNNTNLKTDAILPVDRNAPVDAFGRKPHAALEAAGASTSHLNQASVSEHLGKHAFTKVGKLKATGSTRASVRSALRHLLLSLGSCNS